MKNPDFKSEKNYKEKIIVKSSKLCLKLFVRTFSNDYRHISRPTTMLILSLHIQGPRVLCPLTIGISAVVYFFASQNSQSYEAIIQWWAIIATPAKRQLKAFRWRADVGPLLAVFGSSLPA